LLRLLPLRLPQGLRIDPWGLFRALSALLLHTAQVAAVNIKRRVVISQTHEETLFSGIVLDVHFIGIPA
jgi:hypothetical protein